MRGRCVHGRRVYYGLRVESVECARDNECGRLRVERARENKMHPRIQVIGSTGFSEPGISE